ncbi:MULTISPECIES: phage holin family protein [Pacificibacter]|uniref:phage holin family protein n=1 Tax=Pacificibacter TaxID=1042323 RepID=UPI001C0824EE|nr:MULTISPECIES: phage holin family protein [Pacificibacter]MBU2935883.1 phage holin family protein [Pacificibacter marinus]MDO6614378.1 phage holin family protein [Pacificibacter sp. 1_MG-2023]
MINTLQEKAAQGAKRAAWATMGTVLLCVGIAFLTTAAWMVLSTLQDTLFAALVIGFVYTGLGGIAVALGASSNRPPKKSATPLAPPARKDDTFERMAAAFLTGFQSAKDYRR